MNLSTTDEIIPSSKLAKLAEKELFFDNPRIVRRFTQRESSDGLSCRMESTPGCGSHSFFKPENSRNLRRKRARGPPRAGTLSAQITCFFCIFKENSENVGNLFTKKTLVAVGCPSTTSPHPVVSTQLTDRHCTTECRNATSVFLTEIPPQISEISF